MASKLARIWRRTWFGALLGGGTLLLLAWAHGPSGRAVALGAGAVLALLSLGELALMARAPGSRLPGAAAPWALPALVLGSVYVLDPGRLHALPLIGALEGSPGRVLELFGLCAVAALLGALPSRLAGRSRSLAGVLLGGLWVVFPLLALGLVRELHGGPGLLAVLILSKVGDIAGYYVGNACGRSHPFPRLSPGKTTEGCLGSLGAGILAGLVCQQLGWLGDPRLGLASGPLFGALVNLGAQGGDLLESLAKRRAGVKDSSTLFGPSGGTLDVVDSLLLSVPVALLVHGFLFAAAALPG